MVTDVTLQLNSSLPVHPARVRSGWCAREMGGGRERERERYDGMIYIRSLHSDSQHMSFKHIQLHRKAEATAAAEATATSTRLSNGLSTHIWQTLSVSTFKHGHRMIKYEKGVPSQRLVGQSDSFWSSGFPSHRCGASHHASAGLHMSNAKGQTVAAES